MKINEHEWKSIEINKDPLKINEHRRKAMNINENQWKIMENDGKIVETTQNHIERCGFHWFSLVFIDFH